MILSLNLCQVINSSLRIFNIAWGILLRPFGEIRSIIMRAYAQSGQYHTIVESRVSNMVSEPCPKLNHVSRILKY